MATPPEQPWSNYEKNYLLAEIIKATNPPASTFFGLIRELNVQPHWEDIPLPPGRSLNSSRYAFEELRRSLSLPLGTPLTAHTPKYISSSGPLGLKRSYPYETAYSTGASGTSGREIRPKLMPSSASPYSTSSPTDANPPISKRKRGRPTKAEALAKAEAAAAASASMEPGPTSGMRPPTQPALQPQPPFITGPMEEVKLAPLPTTTRMPIAAMLTPTAREPSKSTSHSSSSSGKRRRARSTKSEPEESPVTRSTAARQEYRSPYTGSGAPDTPARAAVMRTREESSSGPSAGRPDFRPHEEPGHRDA